MGRARRTVDNVVAGLLAVGMTSVAYSSGCTGSFEGRQVDDPAVREDPNRFQPPASEVTIVR